MNFFASKCRLLVLKKFCCVIVFLPIICFHDFHDLCLSVFLLVILVFNNFSITRFSLFDVIFVSPKQCFGSGFRAKNRIRVTVHRTKIIRPMMPQIQTTSPDPVKFGPDPGLQGLQRSSDSKSMKTKKSLKYSFNIKESSFIRGTEPWSSYFGKTRLRNLVHRNITSPVDKITFPIGKSTL